MSTSRRSWIWMTALSLAAICGGARAEVPAHNRADQREAPPRPEPSSAERRAQQLFDAIVRDEPA
ncbi:MAG TPA: hypothetical protein VFN67_18005, partial [Polyangiales bacterium]|nr:hypothetical protein [Polyangiales bacterium]